MHRIILAAILGIFAATVSLISSPAQSLRLPQGPATEGGKAMRLLRRIALVAVLATAVSSSATFASPTDFTIHGVGKARVNLPHSLSEGDWSVNVTLRKYGHWGAFTLEFDDGTFLRLFPCSFGFFCQGTEAASVLRITSGQAGKSTAVADGPDGDIRWFMRFKKRLAPPPPPPPPTPAPTDFTIHGVGAARVDLPGSLREGMWGANAAVKSTASTGIGVFRLELGDVPIDLVRPCNGGSGSGCYNTRRFRVFASNANQPATVVGGATAGIRWSIRFVWEPTGDPPPPAPDPNDPQCPVQFACLTSGYRVKVEYMDPNSGVWTDGGRNAMAGENGALFHFYDPASAEVLVKVTNGCAINGHWWVYSAPATDLAYRVTVWPPRGRGYMWWTGRGTRTDNPAFTRVLAITATKAFRCDP